MNDKAIPTVAEHIYSLPRNDNHFTYCYQIEGSVYAASVYCSDFGRFYLDDVNPEPGNFQITTGYISDPSIKLPVTSLTYNDILRLTVKAKDASGNVQTAVIYFKNVY